MRAADLASSGLLVDLRVCYDPKVDSSSAHPGVFTGVIGASAPGLQGVTLDIKVTLRDPDAPIYGIVAGLIGLLAGVAVRWWADRGATPSVGTLDLLVMAGAGVVAALGAYWKLLDAQPGFDATVRSVWPVLAAAFTATITGKTLVDAFRRQQRDDGAATNTRAAKPD
jgi:hypothetical protein